jgi:pathogenesis-related protein 1
MRTFRTRSAGACLLLALCGCGAGAAAGPDAGGAVSDVSAWLAEHNAVRAGASPTPSPALAALTWSASASSVALGWAKGCTWSHNPGRGELGENIAAATGELTPASVVAMWAGEAKDYAYATDSCSAVCGHYTQLVWRDTREVGCAIERCESGSPFGGGSWTFAVCDYSPPGNWVGHKPY